MQEKKNKRLAITLLMLIIITALTYWLTTSGQSIGVDKDIFRLADYKSIDKIVIASGKGQIELSSNGSRWKVNNHFEADRNLILQLFATLQQLEPKREAPASLRDSLDNWLNENGISISLFNGQQLEQRLIAGGNSLKRQTWLKKPDANIYMVTIPGYRVHVAEIFELTENQWRDKYAFGFNWRNFEALKVEFPDKPSENFRVSLKGNFFAIEELPRTDTAKLNTFLDKVSLLTVNDYLEPGKLTDSLKDVRPFMVVKVTDIAKKEYLLKLFREPSGHIPGLIGENQGVIFNRLKIQPIIRPKSFFELE